MGTQIDADPRGGRGVKPPVFLTGATGFLGMEVMARLLERGDREVIALVRAPDDAAAQERLDGILAKLWARPVAVSRARARGRGRRDVARARDGRRARARAVAEEAGAVMHCAASISFDLPLDEARQINVEGTREIIGFAREAKNGGRLDRFIHVSTAYVAGITEGTFRERQLDAGQEFRNTYEQTKWEAEHVVNDASDLNPVIARPVDRDGRVRVGLDAGLQRPVLADPRVLARALRRGPGAAGGAGGRRARSTTSPTRWCTCSRTRPPRASSTWSPAARPAPSTSWSAMTVRRVRQGAPAGRRPRLDRHGLSPRRRPGRGVLPVLRHGHGLRRLARPRAARPGGDQAART